MTIKGSAVLLRPVITERSMSETNGGRYTFAVAKDATKRDIADAISQSFKVDVIAVNVIHVPGKTRRLGRRTGTKPDWIFAMTAGSARTVSRTAPAKTQQRSRLGL